MTVVVHTDYPVSTERLWEVAIDYGALARVMKGLVSFEGLPAGSAQAGKKLNVSVSLLGLLPKSPYVIEVLTCDSDAMIMKTVEYGSGVKSWRHTMTVSETPEGSRLTDRIQIEAGILTWPAAMFARYIYRARKEPRMQILMGK